jgi:hypothetical protein
MYHIRFLLSSIHENEVCIWIRKTVYAAINLQLSLITALLNDGVDECTNTVAQPYPAVIAVLEYNSRLPRKTNAFRRSCQDYRPRLEGGSLREERHRLPDIEDLVANNNHHFSVCSL